MNAVKSFAAAAGRGLVKLGKALMLPIAVLPIAGLLLRLGQPDLLNIAFISEAGGAVFNNLPIIFALGVAIGFADENHGAAALASFVGYVILTSALKVLDPNINMGVLGGIIVGVTAGLLYNKYKTSSCLPTWLSSADGVLCPLSRARRASSLRARRTLSGRPSAALSARLGTGRLPPAISACSSTVWPTACSFPWACTTF